MIISANLFGAIQPLARRPMDDANRYERSHPSKGAGIPPRESSACRVASTDRAGGACSALRSRTVPRAAGADEVASALRVLAPALNVAGSLAAVSGTAAVVLYRLGNIDKKIEEKFEILANKIDNQGKHLNEKIDNQGKYLSEIIDKQGKDLSEKIDKQDKNLNEKLNKQENSIAVLSADLRALGNDLSNIKGRLNPWYPPASWDVPRGAPIASGQPAAKDTSSRATGEPST